MRRGRGKGKRQNVTAREDKGSGEEEKIPAYRRRGRPQKLVKDDDIEGEAEEEEEIVKNTEHKEKDDDDVIKNGRKRKKSVESKESNITEEEENGLGSKSSTDDSMKSSLSIGFRQNGSRRKNKPRRAAEAVVECNGV